MFRSTWMCLMHQIQRSNFQLWFFLLSLSQGLQTVTLESGSNHQEAICSPTHLHLPHHLMWLDHLVSLVPLATMDLLWVSFKLLVTPDLLVWSLPLFILDLLVNLVLQFHSSLTHQLHLLIRNINYIHSFQTTLKNLDKMILESS